VTLPGFTIGGIHTDTFGIYLASKNIDLLPQSRDIQQTIYGRSGVLDYATEHDVRMINLNLAVIGSSRADAITKMRAFAAQINPANGYQQLIFDDDPGYYYLAKYTSATNQPSIEYALTSGEFPMDFKTTDPFIYSTTPKSVSVTNGQHITNNGSTSCPVVMTITGTGSTIIGINGTTVTYSGTSGTIVIDTGNMTVTLNGVNAMSAWSGDFPQLSSGDNLITVTSGSVTFAYTERWV
jgi:phage-related protein